jgi:Family of unknown function (DUF6498)
LKTFIKRRLTFTDIFWILINLVPLWGVWFAGWNAKEVFLVYCMESIIAGGYNIIMMLATTMVIKKDAWSNGGQSTMVSGYFFILFFIVHYGFFVFMQMSLFLSISGIGQDSFGPFALISFILNVGHYLSADTLNLLWLFVAAYGFTVLKDFFVTGAYKTASLNNLLFAPYARIFVQQFCVIIGAFLLSFNLGNIFIMVFVVVKIIFEFLLDFKAMISQKILEASKNNKTGSL